LQGDTLHLEITPNRPDWLCVEGIARSCFSYVHKKCNNYVPKKSSLNISIDPSLNDIRPFFAGALISNIQMSTQLLDSIIQLQEKLHDTLGRNRKKLAIGLHDTKNISAPFLYTTTDANATSFIPLTSSESLSCAQILSQHEKGKKYSHLVGNVCPIIFDSKKQVLSFPPIINGELTKVTTLTKEIFVDCTGTHNPSVLSAVNIICACFADRGAIVHEIFVNNKRCELFKPQKTPLKLNDINKILGTNLNASQVKTHLTRMGHTLKSNTILSPAFRTDILHPVDITEDIAISIGYNNFSLKSCDFISDNLASNSSAFSASIDAIHDLCIGLGYFEVSSWILTDSRVLEKALLNTSCAIRVQNPLTQDFTTLRPVLYPNLLQIVANSKSQPMPQNLYELGPVLNACTSSTHVQSERLCVASVHPKSSFWQLHSHLKSLCDACSVSFSLLESECDGFITGRCARIVVDSKQVGVIGEVHPQVLENFAIEQPVALFEIDISVFSKQKN
jgi:phenylalanyl-tRNA synthetase beta chain